MHGKERLRILTKLKFTSENPGRYLTGDLL
jgi:hypothetical protein